MPLRTPVALFAFNRPDLLSKTLPIIQQAKPSKVFAICDGAREEAAGEDKLVAQCRAMLIDAFPNSTLITNFSEVNLGCKKRVSSGIDWVFDQVEEAIILEDDVLLDPSFFPFADQMLERFRNNDKIAYVGAQNLLAPRSFARSSYHFTSLGFIWGWATWKRVWENYDVDMKDWPDTRQKLNFGSYWNTVFNQVFEGEIDTWDYQWIYTIKKMNGLGIVPAHNLSSNLGFRGDATHTKSDNDFLSAQNTRELEFPLSHPEQIRPNARFDREVEKKIFPPSASQTKGFLGILEFLRRLKK